MLLMRPSPSAEHWITPWKPKEICLLPIEKSLFTGLKCSALPASQGHLCGRSHGRERSQADGVCLLGKEAWAWQQEGYAIWDLWEVLAMQGITADPQPPCRVFTKGKGKPLIYPYPTSSSSRLCP